MSVKVTNVILMYKPVFCRDVWPGLSRPLLSSPLAVLSAGTDCPSENNAGHYLTKDKGETAEADFIHQGYLSTADTAWTKMV